jgi:hypothetical protein
LNQINFATINNTAPQDGNLWFDGTSLKFPTG